MLFWDSISQLLGSYPRLAENHYPQFFHDGNINEEVRTLLDQIDTKLEKITESKDLRDRLKRRVEDIRDQYDSGAVSLNVRITDVGTENLGIEVRGDSQDHWQLTSSLQNIDKLLFDDGYNTAWVYERPQSDKDTLFEDYRFTGKIHATVINEGEPEIPDITSGKRTSSHKNLH